jgi:hypothetical protein
MEYRKAERGFSAARLAQHSDCFPWLYREIDLIERWNFSSVSRRVMNRQFADLDQRFSLRLGQ